MRIQEDNRLGQLTDAPDDYVVLDVETTGVNHHRAKIIEIAAVKYINKIESGVLSTLIDPGMNISNKITSITGIRNKDIDGAPPIDSFLPKLKEFIGNLPIVAHNAPFDMDFLSDAFSASEIAFENRCIDTLVLAKSIFSTDSYKLEDLKQFLGLSNQPSHRALPDVYTTAALFDVCAARLREWDESTRKSIYLEASAYHYHGKKELNSTISDRFSNIPKPKDIQCTAEFINPNGMLYQKTIVFTGELSISRGDAMQIAANAGATVRGTVSSRTDYLVVGQQDLSLVGYDGMSSKEEKAHELNAAGKGRIEIISESEFLELASTEKAETDEQMMMFGQPLDVGAFEEWIQGILLEVLDRNTIEHKHLVIRKNKGYTSVLYRNATVFAYKFSGKQNWIQFPYRYSGILSNDNQINYVI